MPDERTTSARKPFIKERAQGEARLDHERAASELKRFLDLAASEMGLAIECEHFDARFADGGKRG